MIIDAVTPLLMEFGPQVTSRQIADAAGIAEGTVYRAFADKESLINAVLEKQMDFTPLRSALSAIDPGLPLDDKVLAAVTAIQGKFQKVFGLMALFGDRRPHTNHPRDTLGGIFETMLASETHRLNCSPEMVARIIRLLAFSTSIPHLNDGVTYTPEELTDIVLYGIAGATPSDPTPRRP